MIGANVLLRVLGACALAAVLLIMAHFLIWSSRKVMGRMQDRRGPTNAGPFALLQSFADTMKLMTKAWSVPEGADRGVFIAAPIMMIFLALTVWAVVPLGSRGLQVVDLEVGAFYVVAVSSLAPVSMMMAGGASRSPGNEVGAYRAVSRVISYKIPQMLGMLVPVLLSGSMALQKIILAQRVPYVLSVPLAALVFLLASAAEIGRVPFALPEAGSEIVPGYVTPYSGMLFSGFYLAQFINHFTLSVVFSILFLGGWQGPWAMEIPLLGVVWLFAKAFLVFNLIVLGWAGLPRLRLDQALAFNWKGLVPLGMVILLAVAFVDKGMAGMGITSAWTRRAGLLAANGVIGMAVVALLVRVEHARRHSRGRYAIRGQ